MAATKEVKNINERSRNEINELLSDYIVVPVNSSIDENSKKILSSNSDLTKAFNERIAKVQTEIARLSSTVYDINEIVKEINEDNISDINDQLDDVAKLLGNETISSVKSDLKSDLHEHIQEILDLMDIVLNDLSSKITAFENNNTLVTNEAKTEIVNQINDYYGKLKLLITEIESLINANGIKFAEFSALLNNKQDELKCIMSSNSEIENKHYSSVLSYMSKVIAITNGTNRQISKVFKDVSFRIENLLERMNKLEADGVQKHNELLVQNAEESEVINDSVREISALLNQLIEENNQQSNEILINQSDFKKEIVALLERVMDKQSENTEATSRDLELSESTNNLLNSINEGIGGKVSDYHEKNENLIERKYKALFALSLSLGIINLIGIIIIILNLFFIK